MKAILVTSLCIHMSHVPTDHAHDTARQNPNHSQLVVCREPSARPASSAQNGLAASTARHGLAASTARHALFTNNNCPNTNIRSRNHNLSPVVVISIKLLLEQFTCSFTEVLD